MIFNGAVDVYKEISGCNSGMHIEALQQSEASVVECMLNFTVEGKLSQVYVLLGYSATMSP